MTPKEAESYKTWATNKGTKEGFAVATSTLAPNTPEASVLTVVRKPHAGLTYSITFNIPMTKPRAESDDAFLTACKAVDRRIAAAGKKK